MTLPVPLGYSPSDTPANCDLDAISASIATLQGGLGIVPADGRTVTTLAPYLANNAVFNVKDYGAKGDGVTDDTAAINLAVTKAMVVAGTVRVPPGTYVISGDITASSACRIELDGAQFVSAAGRFVLSTGVTLIDEGKRSSITFASGDPALSLDRAIRVEGSWNGAVLPISAPIAAGDSHFVVTNASDAASLVLNAWVYVGEWVLPTQQMRCEWKQVESVVGTTVNVTSPFRTALSLYSMGFVKITPAEDVTVHGITVITTNVVTPNYGVDAELCRNFRLTECTFDIALGMAWQVYWQIGPYVARNVVDRQAGSRSSIGSWQDGICEGNTFSAKYGMPTAGALSIETAACWSIIRGNTAYGVDLSGIFFIDVARFLRIESNTLISDGAHVGILIDGGEAILTQGNDGVNVLAVVQIEPNTSFSPTYPATACVSRGDRARVATYGVHILTGATASAVYFLDTDVTVGTPVLDAGTSTFVLSRGAGAGLPIPAGSSTPSTFTITGAPANGIQLQLGSSAGFGAVGTRYSGGDAYLVTNATQAIGSDLWMQSAAGSISTLILADITGSIFFYTAPANTASAVFATFWTLVGQIDANGFLNMISLGGVKVGSVKVLGARATGWTAQTTSATRADMGASPNLTTVYETLAAVINDLTTHGILGP